MSILNLSKDISVKARPMFDVFESRFIVFNKVSCRICVIGGREYVSRLLASNIAKLRNVKVRYTILSHEEQQNMFLHMLTILLISRITFVYSGSYGRDCGCICMLLTFVTSSG
jgi:hypothetical protein